MAIINHKNPNTVNGNNASINHTTYNTNRNTGAFVIIVLFILLFGTGGVFVALQNSVCLPFQKGSAACTQNNADGNSSSESNEIDQTKNESDKSVSSVKVSSSQQQSEFLGNDDFLKESSNLYITFASNDDKFLNENISFGSYGSKKMNSNSFKMIDNNGSYDFNTTELYKKLKITFGTPSNPESSKSTYTTKVQVKINKNIVFDKNLEPGTLIENQEFVLPDSSGVITISKKPVDVYSSDLYVLSAELI